MRQLSAFNYLRSYLYQRSLLLRGRGNPFSSFLSHLSPAAKKVVWLQVYQILIYQFKAPLQETEESFVFCGNLDTHEAAKVQMELFLHRGITEGMSESAIDQSWDAL